MTERSGPYRVFEFGLAYDFAQSAVRSKRSREDFFTRFVRPAAGASVLDFGCGTGDALRFLPAVQYCGIDSNVNYLRRARRRYASRGEFVEGGINELSALPSGEYDLVLALGVLHHLDNLTAEQAIVQFARVLRPGGRFVSHDPVLVDGQGRLARWFVQHDRGRHVRAVEQIVRLARVAFARVEPVVVPRPLRIPFTEIALVCCKP